MNKLTELEKAHLAGFFDGDGCITILRDKRRAGDKNRSPAFRLHVSITQCNYYYMQFIREKLGFGRLYVNKIRNPIYFCVHYLESVDKLLLSMWLDFATA